jgi:hypothetical protein
MALIFIGKNGGERAETSRARPRDPRPRPGRLKIDIGALLTLAYRTHVVDRVTRDGILCMGNAAGPGGSPTAGILAVWDDETLGRAPSLGVDVLAAPGGWRVAPRRQALPAPGARGYRAGVPIAAPLPPDAPSRPLHTIETAGLVVACARAGLPPDVSPLVVERWRPVYHGRRRQAAGYLPVWQTAPTVIALERATYAAWHVALTLLAARLTALAGYRVLPPEAPAEPWCGEAETHRVPCPGLRL